jgi:hypothetical protein
MILPETAGDDDPGAALSSLPRSRLKGPRQPLFEIVAAHAFCPNRALDRVHVQCQALSNIAP